MNQQQRVTALIDAVCRELGRWQANEYDVFHDTLRWVIASMERGDDITEPSDQILRNYAEERADLAAYSRGEFAPK